MRKKYVGELDCMQCGYCCGYRRGDEFGGAFYGKNETVPFGVTVIFEPYGARIPVDDDDVCIYLEKLDNGFARCSIQDKKPSMCKLYFCLIERKIKVLSEIKKHLEAQCKIREAQTNQHLIG